MIPCTINIMLTGEQPLCSQTCPTFILTRAHKKFFLEKKMPLCHLPCVYGGSRGGIMVALVAFSGESD